MSEQAGSSKRRKSVCIGCGTVVSGRLSEEHILPKWLHPHVEMKEIKLVHSAANGNEEKVLRQHIIQNFVTRIVCAKCNTGWMSQLELLAKPILLPLIQGLRSVKSLSTEERLVISRWVFKTSFMIFGVQHSVAVPWDVFSSWAKDGAGPLPKHTMVFGMSLSEPHRSHRSFGYLVTEDECSNGKKINIRLGIIIQAFVVLVLLPLSPIPQEIGIEDPNIRSLFPENLELHLLPRTPRQPPSSFEEFLNDLIQRVRFGTR
jgi:hypothetical protein